MNETDRAWLAGFIDGEGCFHAAIQRRPTVRSYPQFHISNCNRVVMEHVAKLLGVEGKLKGKRGGKDGWRCKWTLTLCDAKRLLWLLDLVEPYLVAKREEAAVFRAFCSTFRGYKAPRPIPREVAAERLRLVAELRAIRQREYSV